MITAVDTSILVDILEPDPQYGPASKAALQHCLQEGSIVACEIVWAEVATAYVHAMDQLLASLDRINLGFSSMRMEASMEAAKRWHVYRQQGGKRERIAADFLIGGHALVQCDRLLTRDRGFYREYFKNLTVQTP